jgi:hypothetical protein
MEEAIGKGDWHLEDSSAVLLAIARSSQEPTVWHHIVADATIKDQLLRDPLHGRRGHVELIEEENPSALAR